MQYSYKDLLGLVQHAVKNPTQLAAFVNDKVVLTKDQAFLVKGERPRYYVQFPTVGKVNLPGMHFSLCRSACAPGHVSLKDGCILYAMEIDKGERLEVAYSNRFGKRSTIFVSFGHLNTKEIIPVKEAWRAYKEEGAVQA